MATLDQEIAKAEQAAKNARRKAAELRRRQRAEMERRIGAELRPLIGKGRSEFKAAAASLYDELSGGADEARGDVDTVPVDSASGIVDQAGYDGGFSS